MKIGCCTNIKDLGLAKEAGFDYAELAGRSIMALDDTAFSQLLQDKSECGLPCPALNAYCPPEIVIAGPGFSAENTRNYAGKCAERAGQLGVLTVGIGSPFSRILPEDYPKDLAIKQISEFLTITADEFSRHGITVCIESLGECYCNFINSVDESLMLVEKLKLPNLKIVIDFYQMEHSREDTIDIAPFINCVAHAHTSDDDGSPQLRSFLHEDRRSIHEERIRRLAVAGYNGRISLETDVPFDMEKAVHSLSMLREAID